MTELSNELNIISDLKVETASNDLIHYKCKKCRYTLFNANNCVKHYQTSNERFNADDNRNLKTRAFNNKNNIVCSKEIFIEQIEWLTNKIEFNDGKVSLKIILEVFGFINMQILSINQCETMI